MKLVVSTWKNVPSILLNCLVNGKMFLEFTTKMKTALAQKGKCVLWMHEMKSPVIVQRKYKIC